jgi:hypothetical protein
VIVNEGKILGGQQQPTVQIGGPASLVVRNNSAVLLERNGRLNRVLGPDFYRLRRFEKVRTIIDLRPRRTQYNVEGMSSEGVPVRWTFDIDYQINDIGKRHHAATPQNPFPFSEERVLQAATHQWLGEPGSADPNWWDHIMFVAAEPELRRIMARYTLVQLLEPRTPLREVKDVFRQTAASNGAKLIALALGNPSFVDPVTEQWHINWKRKWDAEMRKTLAPEQAKLIIDIEKAKADAKRQMVDGFTRAYVELAKQAVIPPEAVIMRFIETLRRFGTPEWGYPATEVPGYALKSLEKLEQLLAAGDAKPKNDDADTPDEGAADEKPKHDDAHPSD